MNQRKCGTCTACCKTHPVREISKPAGVWCTHCVRGSGCAIYTERPDGCASFSCQWLKGTGSEADKPSRIGVVHDYVEYAGLGPVHVLFVSHVRAPTDAFIQMMRGSARARGENVLVIRPRVRPILYLNATGVLPLSRFCLEDGRECSVFRDG